LRYKYLAKQFLYIAHAVSSLAFGGVYGMNYKLNLGLSLISQIAYSLIITIFVSLGLSKKSRSYI
jgi:hypothetical protein